MEKKADIVVIGGGISGCAAAHELQKEGIDYLLLEKNVEPGGLTRSISVGDAHFDYTGHYLHLSKCNSPSEIPHAKQKDEDWQLVERNSVIYLDGEIIPAPFQYNLYALPGSIRDRCIKDFRNRPYTANPQSFRDYLLSGFGKGISNIFLFPYNEKQMALSLENLSIDASNRFFPSADVKKIEDGYKKQNRAIPLGYNNYFWYPKYNGIGLLAKGLSKDIGNMYTCCNVKKIDILNKTIITSQEKIKYEKIISSIPLKNFCYLTNDSKLHNLANALSHNRVLCLNLLFRGQFNKRFNGCHWIYVPDKKIPFYRVGIYSHLSQTFVPSGLTAIYVEVAYNYKANRSDLNIVLNNIFFSLSELDWMHRRDCTVMSVNWIDCAYVHFDQNRKRNVKQIFNILKRNNIYPIGRYGLWDYISMEDSIFSGIEVAKKIAQNF